MDDWKKLDDELKQLQANDAWVQHQVERELFYQRDERIQAPREELEKWFRSEAFRKSRIESEEQKELWRAMRPIVEQRAKQRASELGTDDWVSFYAEEWNKLEAERH